MICAGYKEGEKDAWKVMHWIMKTHNRPLEKNHFKIYFFQEYFTIVFQIIQNQNNLKTSQEVFNKLNICI